MNIDTLTDEFLVFLIRQNNKDALSILESRYHIFLMGFLRGFSQSLKKLNLEYDVTFIELRFVLFQALESYEYTQGFFYIYWRLIAKQAIIHLLERESRYLKNTNVSFSLDEPLSFEDSDTEYHEVISDQESDFPQQCFESEVYAKIADSDEDLLSLHEKIVMAYYTQGYSFLKISSILKMTIHCVRKHYMLAVRKLQKTYITPNL